MIKSELIEALATKMNIKKVLAEQIVAELFGGMTETLKRGHGIEFRGFGSFSVREYQGYEGRNPRTGETVKVAPKRLPFFKVGKELKETVDAPGSPSVHDEEP